MSGYFSRLIQQTGIALGTGKVSDGGNLQDAIAPHFGSEIVQIQSEENQEIEKEETQENELNPIVEEKNLVQPQFLTKQNAENANFMSLPKVETESSSPILEAEKTIIEEHKLESLSAQFTSSRNAIIATENYPDLPKSYHQEANEIPKEHTADSRFMNYTPERDIPVGTRQCRVPIAATRQINLQTVREWVAETPEENPNSQFPIPNSQQHDTAVTDTRIAIFADARYPMPDAQFPIPNSPFPNYPVQKNQNFVLSIGTISLTVEAPQSEVKKTPLPPIKSKQEVKPVSQTSRLSRHYIR
jgi:hypothetical protein